MTSDEILTALRCCASSNCAGCPSRSGDPLDTGCVRRIISEAADLIEFQQRGLEALTKMGEGLKKHGSTLREFLRRGDEIVQGHRDPVGPRGPIGLPCPACGSKNVFWNAEKDINTCADCGWQDKGGLTDG